MKVSINTAVFLDEMQAGVSQFDCLKELSDKPIKNIEVRGEFFKDETRSEELREISRLCQENKWGFYFSIPEELFVNGQLNRKIFDYLILANENNIKGLKISLGGFSTLNEEDIMDLNSVLEINPVQVTVENQPNENGVLTTFKKNLEILLEAVPKLGYTFDSGNWYWNNEQPHVSFRELKQHVTIFHLKDIKDRDTVMLGEGLTDWKSLLKDLSNETPVFLEYGIPKNLLDEEIEKVHLT